MSTNGRPISPSSSSLSPSPSLSRRDESNWRCGEEIGDGSSPPPAREDAQHQLGVVAGLGAAQEDSSADPFVSVTQPSRRAAGEHVVHIVNALRDGLVADQPRSSAGASNSDTINAMELGLLLAARDMRPPPLPLTAMPNFHNPFLTAREAALSVQCHIEQQQQQQQSSSVLYSDCHGPQSICFTYSETFADLPSQELYAVASPFGRGNNAIESVPIADDERAAGPQAGSPTCIADTQVTPLPSVAATVATTTATMTGTPRRRPPPRLSATIVEPSTSKPPRRALLRPSTSLASAVFMSTAMVIASLFAFLSFYLYYMSMNSTSVQLLLHDATRYVISSIRSSTSAVTELAYLTYETLQCYNITGSDDGSASDGAQIMGCPLYRLDSVLATLLSTVSGFRPFVTLMNVVFANGVYVGTRLVTPDILAAANTRPVVSPCMRVDINTLQVIQPVVAGWQIDFGHMLNATSPWMEQVALPWSRDHGFRRFWLHDLASYSGVYFNFVLPFELNGALGFCNVGFESSVDFSYLDLNTMLRKNGRYIAMDIKRGLLLRNSWGQPTVLRQPGNVTPGTALYRQVRLDEISDPIVQHTMVAVKKMGGVAALLRDRDTVLVSVKYKNLQRLCNFTRFTDDYGLDIVISASVQLSDFDDSFAASRTVMLCVCIVAIVICTGLAFLTGYRSAQPVRQLVPELARLSTLEKLSEPLQQRPPTAASSTRSLFCVPLRMLRRLYAYCMPDFTEIRDIEDAFVHCREELRTMKSYIPLAVMTVANPTDVDMADSTAGRAALAGPARPGEAAGAEYGPAGAGKCGVDIITFNSNLVLPAAARRREMRVNTRIFDDALSVFRKQACTLALIEIQLGPMRDAIRGVLNLILASATYFFGCVEEMGHSNMLVSFGAHMPLPMHASKGCNFVLYVYYHLPVELRPFVVCLVDSSEFYVGTCGACNHNARAVFGHHYMIPLTKVLWDIGCHVAATPATTSHLPDHYAVPVACVQLVSMRAPLVLCELQLVTEESNVEQMKLDATHFRNGFYLMRSGSYKLALEQFRTILTRAAPAPGYDAAGAGLVSGRQARRLFLICQQRVMARDRTPYLYSVADVYHLRTGEEGEPGTATELPRPPPSVSDTAASQTTHPARAHWLGLVFGVADTAQHRPSAAHEEDSSTAQGSNDANQRPGVVAASPAELVRPADKVAAAVGTGQLYSSLVDTFHRSDSSPLFDVIIADDTGSLGRTGPLQLRQSSAAVVPMTFTDSSGNSWARSLQSIGDGAFSCVYLGMCSEGAQVAIKCIPRHRRDIKQESIETEIRLAAQLRHPNIVQYISCSFTPTHIALIMEYVPGGSLHSVMQEFGPLSETVVRRFTMDILNGLIYLHGGGVVHCDVKPHNMLLDVNGVCKLSDFGSTLTSSSVHEAMGSASCDLQLRGTALYMAPEVARGESCTWESDIFSLGISLLELLLGRLPWKLLRHDGDEAGRAGHDDAAELGALYHQPALFVQRLCRGEVVPDIPDTLSPSVRSFVNACCVQDPSKRPSAQELSEYPFLI